jgi:hypothetical protein
MKLRVDVMEEGYPLTSKPDNVGSASGDLSACKYPFKAPLAGKLTAESLTNAGLVPIRELSPGCGFTPNSNKISEMYPEVTDATGFVLGWHAGGADLVVGDGNMLLKPMNSAIVAGIRETGTKLGNASVAIMLIPLYCVARWFTGHSCDPDRVMQFTNDASDFFQDRIDYINPLNWWHPIKFEVNEARALWQFANTFRDGDGEYNFLPGMNYLYAGPTSPGAIDYGIMIASEMSSISEGVAVGATAAVGLPLGGWPGGTMTVDANNNTGVSTYAKFDEKTRSEQAWERKPMHTTEYSSLDKLAAWGWKEFLDKPGHSAPLGWPIHALGDASNPQHLAGTTGWGHRPFEDVLGAHAAWMRVADYKDDTQRAAVMSAAYKWWLLLNKCAEPDVGKLVRTLARENHNLLGNDWPYNDASSSLYAALDLLGQNTEPAVKMVREITRGGKDVIELMRPSIQNSLGAITALLTCASLGVNSLGDDPNAACPTGMTYIAAPDVCGMAAPATPSPAVPALPPMVPPPSSSCGVLSAFCDGATGCCSGLTCTFGPNAWYRTCEDPTEPPRTCSKAAQACETRADCCFDAVCYADPKGAPYGVCGSDKLWPGDSCNGNAECTSGLCYSSTGNPGDGHCVKGDTNTICRSGADCQSNSCAQGLCQDKLWPGDACSRDEECESGSCVNSTCKGGGVDTPCRSSADCGTGFECAAPSAGRLGTCVPGMGWPGEACTANSQCYSGICYSPTGLPEDGQCQVGEEGSACRDGSDCSSTLCTNNQCAGKRAAGATCSNNQQCLSGSCVNSSCAPGGGNAQCFSSGDCIAGYECVMQSGSSIGICQVESGWTKDTCASNADCRSGVCYSPTGAPADARCSTGGAGKPCRNLDDCDSQLCVAGACKNKLWPNNPCSSNGACASGQCVSGYCNPGGNGTQCRNDFDCVSDARCVMPPVGTLGTCIRQINQ